MPLSSLKFGVFAKMNPPPIPGGIGELSHKLILESTISALGPNVMFRWNGGRPEDNVYDAYPGIDRAEQLFEIEDEFVIKIFEEWMRKVDESFDAIVRYVARQRHSMS
jgi:hypothetical protein